MAFRSLYNYNVLTNNYISDANHTMIKQWQI